MTLLYIFSKPFLLSFGDRSRLEKFNFNWAIEPLNKVNDVYWLIRVNCTTFIILEVHGNTKSF